MDFKDEITQLSLRVNSLKASILTEEATKNALIMPFIKCLGYDVFNPFEVVPEFIADLGIKKGEKVDYLIKKDERPVILIECKHWSVPLNVHDSQLFRYFAVTKSKFGILTNGIHYRFYSDLVAPNLMDDVPFLEFDITLLNDSWINEVKKFHKLYFDEVKITNTASELKCLTELVKLMDQEYNSPSESFVRHFSKQIHKGVITSKVLEQFTKLTKIAGVKFINKIIQERELKIQREEELKKISEPQAITPLPISSAPRIDTSTEEIEAFYIVKSILRKLIAPERIHYRDAQSYMAILLDDNNRRTLCRLYFNGPKKQIAIFDANRNEMRYAVDVLDDIYNISDKLAESGKNLISMIESKDSSTV